MNRLVCLSLFVLLVLSFPSLDTQAEPSEQFTIERDIVYIDDNNCRIAVYPHTISKGGYVYMNLTSKKYSGSVDFLFGFDTDIVRPKSLDLHKLENVTYEEDLSEYWGNGSYTVDYNYSSYEPPIAYDGYVWIRLNDENSTLIYEHYFDWANFQTKVIYWEVLEESWKVVHDKIDYNVIEYEYGDMDRWYYGSRNVTADVNYHLRFYVAFKPTVGSKSGKYWCAFKPSVESLAEAIANGHFYFLDPWWLTGWDYPVYEDFTTFTAVEPLPGRINLEGTNHLRHYAKKNEDSYLYKDEGEDCITDFKYHVDVKSDFLQDGAHGAVWAVSTNVDDLSGMGGSGEARLVVEMINNQNPDENRLRISEYYDGGNFQQFYYVATADTWYYLVIEKQETAFTCGIYSDSARTNELDTLSLTLGEDHSFQYLFACVSLNIGFDMAENNYIENLLDIIAAPNYNEIGYSSSVQNSTCHFYSMLIDDYGLSGYILETNNSGTWSNETWTSLSGTSDTANTTLTLNNTVGMVVGFRFYVNDTDTLWLVTSTISFTIEAEAGAVTYTSAILVVVGIITVPCLVLMLMLVNGKWR